MSFLGEIFPQDRISQKHNEPVAICIHVPHLKYCLRQKKVDYEQGVLN